MSETSDGPQNGRAFGRAGGGGYRGLPEITECKSDIRSRLLDWASNLALDDDFPLIKSRTSQSPDRTQTQLCQGQIESGSFTLIGLHNVGEQKMKTRLLFALAGWALGFALPSLAQWRDTADPAVASKLVSFYNSALAMKYQDAFNRKDSAALAALFTEDAVQVAPEGLFFGRQAIEKRFADLFQRQRFTNFFGARDRLSAIGSDLWAVGEWWSLLPTESGPAQVGGYWSEIYVRDGEAWKIRLSMFNATPPKARSTETE